MDYLLGVLIHSVSKILAVLIDVTGSPGLSVLLLGGLLQALLYVPLRGRHRLNRAMSYLKPEIESLKKQYGKDQNQLNQALQELYRRHNLNPLSGCLTLLVQMPLLFSVWRVVTRSGAWEHATFLWIRPGNWPTSYPNIFAQDLAHFDLTLVVVCALASLLALRGIWGKGWTDGLNLYLLAALSHWPSALVLFWGALSVTSNLIRSSAYQEPEVALESRPEPERPGP